MDGKNQLPSFFLFSTSFPPRECLPLLLNSEPTYRKSARFEKCQCSSGECVTKGNWIRSPLLLPRLTAWDYAEAVCKGAQGEENDTRSAKSHQNEPCWHDMRWKNASENINTTSFGKGGNLSYFPVSSASVSEWLALNEYSSFFHSSFSIDLVTILKQVQSALNIKAKIPELVSLMQ